MFREAKERKGFTLVEMLFYIALLAILLVVVTNSVLLAVTSYRNIRSAEVIESSSIAAMDRMTTEIRDADSVDILNSTFDASPGVITINTATSTPAKIKFDGSTTSLAVYEDNAYSGPLFSRDARVKSLIFRHISTSTSEAVKIELEIESGTGTSYISKKFYDTAILRGSYEQNESL